MGSDVIENASGGYAYIPSSLGFASAGVVSLPGRAIERAVLQAPVDLAAGLDVVSGHLQRLGRPLASLCGLELRMPEVLDRAAFVEFNAMYLARLGARGLLADGGSPLTRTNVVPHRADALTGGVLIACSYVVDDPGRLPGFVVSGVPELPETYVYPEDIVRRGETGQDALRDKAECVVDRLEAYVETLGVRWGEADTVHLYSRHPAAFVLQREVLAPRGLAPTNGLVWHDAAPPVLELELEVDVRRYRCEVVVSPD